MAVSFKSLGNYGHLGNSLFQAACTIALAKRNNDNYRFPSSWKYSSSLSLPVDCFVTNIKPTYSYNEPQFCYQKIPYKPGIDLKGYFQSEKYFADFKKDIRSLFTPRKINDLKEQKKTSIHVRRTDYLNFPNHHPALTMHYYENAMSLFDSNTSFIICSDDIDWCKKHFIGSRFEFSDYKDPILDLILQIKCEHNIIANSSFSWWGAWLNSKNNKVVAPIKWFGPALAQHDTKDLYLPEWTIL